MTRKGENSGFVCAVCGRDVAPISHGTIRDHCPYCLCSLHVDEAPGDRACTCQGILRPVGTDYRSHKGYILIYQCERCQIIKRNRVAADDNFDLLLKVQREQNRQLYL